MEKSTQQLAKRLLTHIYSSSTLTAVSEGLERLTQSENFKKNASVVVTDPHLTDPQKRFQLLYLLRDSDIPVLYDFFFHELYSDLLWLFHNDKIDYFDRFVQTFQRLTETVHLIHLMTAIPLKEADLHTIAEDLSKNFGYAVIVNHSVNQTLLGGVQVRLENLVFDYSLRSRFAQFERQWLKSLRSLENAVNLPPTEITLV